MTPEQIAALSDRALDRAISAALPEFEPDICHCPKCGGPCFALEGKGDTVWCPRGVCLWRGSFALARPWYTGPDWGPVGRLMAYVQTLTPPLAVVAAGPTPWRQTRPMDWYALVYRAGPQPVYGELPIRPQLAAATGPRALSEAILIALQEAL